MAVSLCASLTFALASLTLVLFFAPAASADSVIGSVGAGAGQYERPQGVAVDSSNGHLYLTDAGNNRVDVFEASSGSFLFAFGWKVNAEHPEEKLQVCTFASGCQAGTPGSGPGQFGEFNRGGIAVDPSTHAIYVTEDGHRLQKFNAEANFEWMAGGEVDKTTHANLCTAASGDICGVGEAGAGEGRFEETLGAGLPVAVGPGGAVSVADSKKLGSAQSEGFTTRIQKFEPSGASIGSQLLLPGVVGQVQVLAVDSGGDFYAAWDTGAVQGVRQYDSSGAPVTSWGKSGEVAAQVHQGIRGLAIDPAGDLFLSRSEEILGYDASGAQTLAFFPAPLQGLAGGFAFYEGDFFVTQPSALLRIALPEPGPELVPSTVKACPAANVRATLCATFNSEGKASKARFEYVSKAAFEKNEGEGKEGFAGAAVTPESAATQADFENHTVKATSACVVPTEASCLKPETTYYFRAIASNEDGEVIGEKAEFTTRPPHEIDAVWVTEVGVDSARARAEVNPLGVAAKAHFQYLSEAQYTADGDSFGAGTLESPSQSLGAGETATEAVAQLPGLQLATVYRYRLLVEDAYFPSILSAVHSFATFALPSESETDCSNQVFRTGPSAALPDCRAYEMVSPIDKDNGDVLTRNNFTGNATALDQSAEAGSGFAYTSYRAFSNPKSAPYTNQYRAERTERGQLGEGWSTESLDPPREDAFRFELEDEYKAFSADLSNAWLRQEGEPPLDPCAPAGYDDLYRRKSAGAYEALSCAQPSLVASVEYLPELQGFSADGAKALVRIDNKLIPEASGASAAVAGGAARPIYQLYESSGAGQLHLVSVLPNGEVSNQDSSAGTGIGLELENQNRFSSLSHAISDDGSRVYWSTISGQIYLRLNPDQSQSKFKSGACNQPTKACTVPVSETVTSEAARFQGANPEGTKALFTVTQGPLTGNLYEFDSQAGLPSSRLIAGKVMSGFVLGSSDDLSHVYFASEEASPQEQAEGAQVGKPNVYLSDEGTIRFIATLSFKGGETSDVVNNYGIPIGEPITHTARVSRDGQSLVFMSNGPALAERVAGYDNTDAASGQPDAEVYLYDTRVNEGRGGLRCVSCNPSGERPEGRELERGHDRTVGLWAAARIPTFETQLYQSRYLSDDGRRVFFDSYEPLVLGDTNGAEDAYEWEASGEGGCETGSSSYSTRDGGCLYLVSSGRNPTDSEFLDASADGSDIFFMTAEGLVSQDPGLVDVYDARVQGGFPPPAGAPAGCEGEACQSPPSPPKDATPASAVFSGPGDLLATPGTAVAPKKKTAPQSRAVMLTKALKACRTLSKSKPKPGLKRKRCEAAARRRYGEKLKSKAKKTNEGGKRS